MARVLERWKLVARALGLSPLPEPTTVQAWSDMCVERGRELQKVCYRIQDERDQARREAYVLGLDLRSYREAMVRIEALLGLSPVLEQPGVANQRSLCDYEERITEAVKSLTVVRPAPATNVVFVGEGCSVGAWNDILTRLDKLEALVAKVAAIPMIADLLPRA